MKSHYEYNSKKSSTRKSVVLYLKKSLLTKFAEVTSQLENPPSLATVLNEALSNYIVDVELQLEFAELNSDDVLGVVK